MLPPAATSEPSREIGTFARVKGAERPRLAANQGGTANDLRPCPGRRFIIFTGENEHGKIWTESTAGNVSQLL